jgi:hypothetical protein
MIGTLTGPEASSAVIGDLISDAEFEARTTTPLTRYDLHLALGEIAGRRVTSYAQVERLRFVPRCAGPEVSSEPVGHALMVNVMFHDDATETATPGEVIVWEDRSAVDSAVLQQLAAEAVAGPVWDRIV